MFLEETFRFNDKIADFSSKFIMKNPSQYKKNIVSIHSEEDSVFVVWYDDLNTAVVKILKEIYSQNPKAKVYVLGRYGQGYYKNLDSSFFASNDSLQIKLVEDYSSLDVQYSTIHGVKGSQRDYVILIGVRSGNFGLPCEIEDDPILNLVLAEDDAYPFGEERRIFYVGITRAVNKVYILADKGKISTFIDEICDKEADYEISEFGEKPIKCPLCEDGFLVIRRGSPDFYGCSNYWETGCKYTEQIPVKVEVKDTSPEEENPK